MHETAPPIAQGGLYNLIARPYLPRLGSAHLALWGPTLPLHYAHRTTECTHFCYPGAYHVWVALLAEVLAGEASWGARQQPP